MPISDTLVGESVNRRAFFELCLRLNSDLHSGRHPCAGMRVAKLEMKILVTMMLLGFDLTVVDKQGNPTNEIPGPDRNDILQVSIHRRRWSRFV